jgi:hypothetical protein
MPPSGRRVLAGKHELTVRFQGESQTVKVEVRDDPRVSISRAASVAKDVLRTERDALNLRLYEVTQRLAPIKAQINIVRTRLAIEQKPEAGDDPHKTIRDALKAIDEAHKDLDNKLWGEQKKVQGINRGNDGLMTKIRGHMRISDTIDGPNKTERDGMTKASAKVTDVEQLVGTFFAKSLPTFRKAVADSGLHLLPVEPDSSRK